MSAKINLKLLLSVLLFLGASTFAQSNFEGKVVMRISGEETADMDYFIKGNKVRIEMKSDEGTIAILFDPKDSKTYMLMPAQKMYMELEGIGDTVKNDVNQGDKSADIKRTGEFKDINGYNCEKWIIKNEDDDDIVEAWMTDELGNFYMMTNPMDNSNQDSWQKELQGNYFPMKVDVMEDGEIKSGLEVLSVNKMSLKNDLFEIPGGYHKFDMPKMDMFK